MITTPSTSAKWDAVDIVAERAFSNDAAHAFAGVHVNDRTLFEAVSEVQQFRDSLQRLIDEIVPFGEAMKRGHYYQSGPPQMKVLQASLRDNASRGADFLRAARKALGDEISVPDPAPGSIPPRSAEGI